MKKKQEKKYKNRELEILKDLNHPNVIRLKHYFYTKTEKKEDKEGKKVTVKGNFKTNNLVFESDEDDD